MAPTTQTAPPARAERRDPLGVPGLESLPPLGGKRVLVRATLDLPLTTRFGSPAARQRTALLGETLFWLSRRARSVTVSGERGPRPTGRRRDRRLAEVLRQIAPNLTLAGPDESAEEETAIARLVAGHDVFVNDSFQWSHLPYPSVMIPPATLPSAAGRALHRDLQVGEDLLLRPERPFVAVIGGADPLPRLHGLSGLVLRADEVLVGGAVSQPLLVAIGRERGDGASDFSSECRALFGLASRVQHPIELPQDLVVVTPGGSVAGVPASGDVTGDVQDIGPMTAKRFAEVVEGAGTLLWCGSLGRVEDPRFAEGTLEVARALRGRRPGRTVLAGDALTSLLARQGGWERRRLDGMSLASATLPLLELLKVGDLPALQALRRSPLAAAPVRAPVAAPAS